MDLAVLFLLFPTTAARRDVQRSLEIVSKPFALRTVRLCGLVVRVPGYRSGGPCFDSRALQGKEIVGLERGPLSLVNTTEELLGRNSSGFGLESREYGRRDSSR
jgi:hypothetical protein